MAPPPSPCPGSAGAVDGQTHDHGAAGDADEVDGERAVGDGGPVGAVLGPLVEGEVTDVAGDLRSFNVDVEPAGVRLEVLHGPQVDLVGAVGQRLVQGDPA